jgi:methylated-DNA-[protein]-cysteine S-methyltransferase
MIDIFYTEINNIKLKIGHKDLKVFFVEFTQKIEKRATNNIELEIEKAFADYILKKEKVILLDFVMEGSAFEKEVWNELLKIPYGETRTYGEIAKNIGKRGAARAVGKACGKNKIGIIIPCHRVIGSGGKLTGFAGGIEVKQKLLELEGAFKDRV